MGIITSKDIKGITTSVVASLTISFLWGCSQMRTNMISCCFSKEGQNQGVELAPFHHPSSDDGLKEKLKYQLDLHGNILSNLNIILTDLGESDSSRDGTKCQRLRNKLALLCGSVPIRTIVTGISFLGAITVPLYFNFVDKFIQLEKEVWEGAYLSAERYPDKNISKDMRVTDTCVNHFQRIVVNEFEANNALVDIMKNHPLVALGLLHGACIVGLGLYASVQYVKQYVKPEAYSEQLEEEDGTVKSLKTLGKVFSQMQEIYNLAKDTYTDIDTVEEQEQRGDRVDCLKKYIKQLKDMLKMMVEDVEAYIKNNSNKMDEIRYQIQGLDTEVD